MIQTLELFGGIGAPRAALRNIGIPVKAIDYVEIDEKAVRSYNAMFEPTYKPQNVIGWNLRPDILVHGSPCQDFSIAGKQAGADEGSETRSSLMWKTIKIIKNFGEWKPHVVIWENVKNVRSRYMVHNHERYLNEMEKLGYANSFQLLNSYDFGLPQIRERVFTISILGGKPFDFDKMERRETPPLSEFLSDDFQPWHIVNQPSVLSVVGYKGIKRATVIQEYAYTITTRQDRTPAQIIDLGDGRYRYLTELECFRLMGFNDDDFKACNRVNGRVAGMNRTLYKQAGNSMPVTVLESIFKSLFNEGILKE